ncbi:hypothetical protein ACA910_015519 [Epithemia clementina (nom. ined.)]
MMPIVLVGPSPAGGWWWLAAALGKNRSQAEFVPPTEKGGAALCRTVSAKHVPTPRTMRNKNSACGLLALTICAEHDLVLVWPNNDGGHWKGLESWTWCVRGSAFAKECVTTYYTANP